MVNNFGANILFVIGHGSRYIIQVDDFYKEVFCNEKHCSLIKETREYTKSGFSRPHRNINHNLFI